MQVAKPVPAPKRMFRDRPQVHYFDAWQKHLRGNHDAGFSFDDGRPTKEVSPVPTLPRTSSFGVFTFHVELLS